MNDIREVIGNTIATPNPRPDWLQDDKTKADYIKNKPTILSRVEILELIKNHTPGTLPALGAMATKDEVAKTDLTADVQSLLDQVSNMGWYAQKTVTYALLNDLDINYEGYSEELQIHFGHITDERLNSADLANIIAMNTDVNVIYNDTLYLTHLNVDLGVPWMGNASLLPADPSDPTEGVTPSPDTGEPFFIWLNGEDGWVIIAKDAASITVGVGTPEKIPERYLPADILATRKKLEDIVARLEVIENKFKRNVRIVFDTYNDWVEYDGNPESPNLLRYSIDGGNTFAYLAESEIVLRTDQIMFDYDDNGMGAVSNTADETVPANENILIEYDATFYYYVSI